MTNHLTDKQLNEILDSPSSTSSLVTRHLDSCPECRARLEELRVVFTALESLPEARLPRDLTQSILTQLPRKRIAPAWGWLIAAQVVAAIAITAWLSSSFELPTAILTYQPPSLDSILASLFAFTSSLSFKLPTFNLQLSTFNFQFPTFNLQSSTLILLGVSAAALWVIGNGILLRAPAKRRRPEFIEGSRT